MKFIASLLNKAKSSEGGVSVKNRKHHMRQHKKCFVGSEFVNWILGTYDGVNTREDAVAIAQHLLDSHKLVSVAQHQQFEDSNKMFYRFVNQQTAELEATYSEMKSQLETIKNKKYFAGCDAVDWIVKNTQCTDRESAVHLAELLRQGEYIRHADKAKREATFVDSKEELYKFEKKRKKLKATKLSSQ